MEGTPFMSKNSKKKKITQDLFEKIINEDNLYKAYKKALKGDGKYNPEAMIFTLDEVYNIKMLRQSLIDGTYKFDGYIRFIVYEPKERIIDAPHFKDKIVQLAINNVLKEIYNPCFIFDSYACIDGKGNHKCVDKIQHLMRKAKWEYGEDTTIIKGDVKKFFYSINRGILKKLLHKKIRCKKTLNLLFKIIDSADILDLLGLPLGNTLSQICANIYLNELDQFCKRKLSLKYYIRYMDDFFIFVKNKEEAKRVLCLINEFVEEKLGLKLNTEKTKIFPIEQGLNAIGYKIYITHRLLRDSSKQKVKRKLKATPHLIQEKKTTIEKIEHMLGSWMGYVSYGNSYNFIKSLMIKYGFLCLTKRRGKKVLKINKYRLEVCCNGI
ncbi:MAG TPA: RNA-dependent DNA polymerase [Clostridiales bacterium]|nr:RNA-dependent DNA polymerase [Clostridiales bacterium]